MTKSEMTMKTATQLILPAVIAGGAIVAMGGAAFELWPGESAIAILALLAAIAVVATLASKHQRSSTLSAVAMLAGLAGMAVVATAGATWLSVIGGCLCGAAWLALRFESKVRNSHGK
ncbi:cytochrome bd-type quinol oxidase subunit 2 [Cupriavidus metallidurans]|uniref:hypothetical protein n=1 Tax=Cupriavidus metallidurans TaxID=119219 RepID=UPI000493471D|nr:hypothetical protein [Cupriavidus metallidurans]MDE4919570.1 hypothetical protein [Cupriavidus metallidurans]